MTSEDNNRDTMYTINNDTNNHNAHILHKWAQQRAVSCVSCLTDDVSHHIGSSRSCVRHSIRMSSMMCVSLWSVYLPIYFDLSLLLFFHSSVLMHPDLHTDLDNLDSVESNLRHSAKGSNDAYDVTFFLTELDRKERFLQEDTLKSLQEIAE